MPVIKIEPVELKTRLGNQAVITGIDTGSPHPLAGYVHLKTGEHHERLWSVHGATAEKDFQISEDCLNSAAFVSLKETAIHLMPTRTRSEAGFS